MERNGFPVMWNLLVGMTDKGFSGEQIESLVNKLNRIPHIPKRKERRDNLMVLLDEGADIEALMASLDE